MANPAATYEDLLVPTVFAPATDMIFGVAAPRPGDRVLDVACGTGIVLRKAAPKVGAEGQLSGIDFNPQMIEVAREMVERDGHEADLREASAEDLPYADGEFDRVYCAAGIMFFPDRIAALTEMRRVLKSGGRIGASVWQALHLQQRLHGKMMDAIAGQLGLDEFLGPFVFNEPDELRELFEGAGFEQVEVVSDTVSARFAEPESWIPRIVRAATGAIPAFQQLDDEGREVTVKKVTEELTPELSEYIEDGEVVVDYRAFIVGATAP